MTRDWQQNEWRMTGGPYKVNAAPTGDHAELYKPPRHGKTPTLGDAPGNRLRGC